MLVSSWDEPDIDSQTILRYLSFCLESGSLNSGFNFCHSLICLIFLWATFLIAFVKIVLFSLSLTHSSSSLIYKVSLLESEQWMGLECVFSCCKLFIKISLISSLISFYPLPIYLKNDKIATYLFFVFFNELIIYIYIYIYIIIIKF